MDEPIENSRPWWAVPLIAFAVGLAAASVAIVHVQSYDEPWIDEGAQRVLWLLGAVAFAAGCLYLLPLVRRRRWPWVVGGLAAVALAIGIWLRVSVGQEWSACVRDHYGPDLLGLVNGCAHLELKQQLSAALIPGSVLVLATSWLTAGPGLLFHRAQRMASRPRLLTVVMLVLAVVAAVGGVLGWHSHQRATSRARLAAGEKALARLALPPSLTPAGRGPDCPTAGATTRCAHSSLQPAELAEPLTNLISGATARRDCSLVSPRVPMPCSLYVTGRLADADVVVSASPHIVFLKAGLPVPLGATQLGRQSSRLYLLGSDITISLWDEGD